MKKAESDQKMEREWPFNPVVRIQMGFLFCMRVDIKLPVGWILQEPSVTAKRLCHLVRRVEGQR